MLQTNKWKILPYEYCLRLEYYWTSLICFIILVDANSSHFSYEGLSPGTPFYTEKLYLQHFSKCMVIGVPCALNHFALSHHTALSYSLTRLGMLKKYEDWFY